MNKEKGYCEYCNIWRKCPWFCKKEKDERNNPVEPCFSREYCDEELIGELGGEKSNFIKI